MNRKDCINEKWSSRSIGLVILALAAGLAFIGSLIIPVVGLVFAVPLFIFSFFFLFKPESSVCRMILRNET